ncbi:MULTISPECIES: hypothetical protein [unclassified Rhizobium]|jgi:hypothetical protein|uniref:hypothetical protein n=1 Tax=unclassified Rhizobium TaxID=2613769 RepID=UPI0006482462|nr:hypothetical protein [Rhizobium sp. UBA1881]
MSLAYNEQTKLFANALDRASTACFTVGIVTPIAGALYGIGNFSQLSRLWLAGYLCAWLSVAVLLHYIARLTLRRLIP